MTNLFFLIFSLPCFSVSSHAGPKSITTTPALGVNAPSAQRLREWPLTTLREHRNTLKPGELADNKHLINRDPRALSWAFNLRYMGEIETIAPERQELVNFVAQKNPQLKGLYQYEILVSDGEENFWLPIQNGTLAFFKREKFKKGDRLYAQTRYFGSYFKSVPRQFFLMLGYRRPLRLF